MTSPSEVGSLSGFSLSIDPQKFSRYLLNVRHPRGGPKAAFFLELGFSPERLTEFADAIVEQAMHARSVSSRLHPRGFGIEISAVGLLRAPAGRDVIILTAWNWRPDQTGLRLIDEPATPLATFVSAYSRPERS